MRMAGVQITAKDYDAALQSLRKALALEPNLVDAQRSLVALSVVADRAPEALAMAREMQKQKPTESVGFIMEGDVHASKQAWSSSSRRSDSRPRAVRVVAAHRLAHH